MAATAPFMSVDPRPWRRPSVTTGSYGPIAHSDRSPAGLVSRWPLRTSTGPLRAPTTSPTTFRRPGSIATSRTSAYPSSAISNRARSATLRSSPGGFGLGIATSSRANSTRSCSRAARPASTARSRAFAVGLDGGVRLLVGGTAGAFDPVPAGPADALPGLEAFRLDPEQPARLLHCRFQVGRTVLAQVSIAHAGRDRHPFAADVGPFDQLGGAAPQHLAEGLGLLDDE